MRHRAREADGSRLNLHGAGVIEGDIEASAAGAGGADQRTGIVERYVKTAEGLEVDFFARHPAGGEELIQVCADLSSAETRARELRALTAAANEHPRAARRLLVLDRDARVGAVTPGIEVQPAYEWLLDEPAEG